MGLSGDVCCWADMAFPSFVFWFFLEPTPGSQGAAQESQEAATMKQLKVGMTEL